MSVPDLELQGGKAFSEGFRVPPFRILTSAKPANARALALSPASPDWPGSNQPSDRNQPDSQKSFWRPRWAAFAALAAQVSE